MRFKAHYEYWGPSQLDPIVKYFREDNLDLAKETAELFLPENYVLICVEECYMPPEEQIVKIIGYLKDRIGDCYNHPHRDDYYSSYYDIADELEHLLRYIDELANNNTPESND